MIDAHASPRSPRRVPEVFPAPDPIRPARRSACAVPHAGGPCARSGRYRSGSTISCRWTPAQKAPAGRSACPIGADGKPEVFAVDDLLEPDHAPDFEIAPKEIAHELSMMFDNMQSAVLNPVAERNHPAHPHALLLGRGRRRRPVASRRLCSPCRHASLPPPPASPAIRRRPRRGRYFETLPHVLPPGRQRMVPLCRAGRTAYRGRDHRRDFQPQHDRPRRDWDKPARAATVFIHYGAPPALVGCLDQWRSTRNCMPRRGVIGTVFRLAVVAAQQIRTGEINIVVRCDRRDDARGFARPRLDWPHGGFVTREASNS